MTPFTEHPKCELCESEKDVLCVSEDYKLFLCKNCHEKMTIYWRKDS